VKYFLVIVVLIVPIGIGAGCRPAVVDVNPRADVEAAADVDMAADVSLLSRWIQTHQVTAQKADAGHQGDQVAGGDLTHRPVNVTANVSGSAWPIVASLIAIVAGVLAWAWLRQRRRYRRLESPAIRVAKAIRQLPPDRRDGMLSLIRLHLGADKPWNRDRRDWDAFLRRKGLYVKRSEAADEVCPGAGGTG